MAARQHEAIRRPTRHAAYLSQVRQARNLRTVDNLRTLKVKFLSFAVNGGTRPCKLVQLNLCLEAPTMEIRDSPEFHPVPRVTSETQPLLPPNRAGLGLPLQPLHN